MGERQTASEPILLEERGCSDVTLGYNTLRFCLYKAVALQYYVLCLRSIPIPPYIVLRTHLEPDSIRINRLRRLLGRTKYDSSPLVETRSEQGQSRPTDSCVWHFRLLSLEIDKGTRLR